MKGDLIKMLKKFILFSIIISMLNLLTGSLVNASGSDTDDNIIHVVPGNGDFSKKSGDVYKVASEGKTETQKIPFVADEDLEALIKAKDRLAKEYSEALSSGNNEVAAQKLEAYKKLINAKNTEEHIDNLANPTETNAILRYEGVMLSGIPQIPQEKSYYCGNAAAQSVLYYKGISCTQTQLAGKKYLRTEDFGNTPWYLSDGDSKSQFPMAITLTKLTDINYTPAPYGDAGANPLSPSDLKSKIVATLSTKNGVVICGESKADSSHPSHLPGYPSKNVGHWLVCFGWNEITEQALIRDPAKSEAVSWGGNIQASYSISDEKLAAFAAPRGIIY